MPPAMGGSVDTSFILGTGKVGDEVKILLNIDEVLTANERRDVSCLAEASHPSTDTEDSDAKERRVRRRSRTGLSSIRHFEGMLCRMA